MAKQLNEFLSYPKGEILSEIGEIHEKINGVSEGLAVLNKSVEILIDDFKESKQDLKDHVATPTTCAKDADIEFLLQDKKIQNGKIDKNIEAQEENSKKVSDLIKIVELRKGSRSAKRELVKDSVRLLGIGCTIAALVIAYLRYLQ